MQRNPVSPDHQSSSRSRPASRLLSPAGIVALTLLCGVLLLAGCGRSAPEDALDDTDGDPDIAGVSVTSPDAVVSTEPTNPEAAVTPTSEEVITQTQATYTVQPGDTLSVIAGSFDVSMEELAAANAITDINSIAPGQQLVIPERVVEVTVVDTGGTTTSEQP